jgi:hypothetical protein
MFCVNVLPPVLLYCICNVKLKNKIRVVRGQSNSPQHVFTKHVQYIYTKHLHNTVKQRAIHLHKTFTQYIYKRHLHKTFTQYIYKRHLHKTFTQHIYTIHLHNAKLYIYVFITDSIPLLVDY